MTVEPIKMTVALRMKLAISNLQKALLGTDAKLTHAVSNSVT
jgi:hypothetical protein